jgi:hypothetical protein
MISRKVTFLTAIASLAVATSTTHAQTRVFTNAGTGNDWTNDANWSVGSGGEAADTNAETAQLNALPNLDGNITVNGIQNFGGAPSQDLAGPGVLTIDRNLGGYGTGITNFSAGSNLKFSSNVIISNSLGGNTGVANGSGPTSTVEFAGALTLTTRIQLVGSGINFNGTIDGATSGAANFTMNNDIVGITFGALADNSGYAGDFVMNTNNGVISDTTVVGGFLRSGSKVQVNGTGSTLTLNGAQGMEGNLVVGGGNSLTLDANANQSNMGVLNVGSGGVFSLDLDAGVSELFFSDSSAFDWTGATIAITGFKENTIRFGTDVDGLTTDQLSVIDGGIYSLTDTGFLSIPEPSSYGLIFGATGLMMVFVRRRR